MHVLLVSSWYPDAHDSTLGIFVKRHAEAIAGYCKVSVISFSASSGKGWDENQDSGIFHICLRPAKSKGFRDFGSQFLSRNALFAEAVDRVEAVNGSIDIIQLNVIFPAIMWMYLWLIRSKQALVIAEHWSGYLPHDGRYRGILMSFFSFSAVRRSSLVLCVSQAQQAAMLSHGLKGKFDYLPNVADDEVFFRIPQIDRCSDVWIHVSNLDPVEKNTELLLQLFAMGLTEGIVSRMIVCGGTPDKVEAFHQRASALHLEDYLEITGNISPGELNQHMNRAGLFVLSSHFEGQPCVILEAMLTGLKVVAPDVGDISHLLGDGRGYIYKTGQAEDAMRAIRESYSEPYGADTVAFVRRQYSHKAVGAYLFSHYLNLLPEQHG